ncbi:hypothetical protein KR074_006640 [Drosophila pseudoananassae]|nr:hypothetical protein KR074_006640 [Drosophila pseudoananassae]
MDLLQEVKKLTEFEAFSGHLAHNQSLNPIVLDRADPSECGVELGFNTDDKQICTKLNHGDICTEDTGGPLVRRILWGRKYGFMLLGITSIVSDSCQGNLIFTNVMSYVDWIDYHVNPSFGETESEDQDNNTSPPPPNPATTEGSQEQPQFLNSDCGEYTSGIHPWSIHIYGDEFMAKGTVITDRFILTNAHNMPNEPNLLEVNMVDSTGSYEFYVDLVIKHPEYRDKYQNDIALLRLTKPLSSTVIPICLITNPTNKEKVVRLNYSLIINENKNALIKEVRRLPSYECAEKISKPIDENQFCVTIPAGTEHGNPGDIIGLDLNDAGKHKYTITGIASYTKNEIKVITDVVKHSEWISQEVQKHHV